jgi:excisionase family DNA binding protein
MLTVKEAARSAGVKPMTLYTAMQQGRLRSYRTSGRILISRFDLNDFLSCRRRRGRPPKADSSDAVKPAA